MIAIEEAQRLILKHTAVLTTEEVPLLQGVGRVIARDAHAPWDIPMSDNSAMDGYAFSALPPQNGQWVVADFIPAGAQRTIPVAPGEAVKIMTGAPIPPGCDTVAPIEEVERTAEGIRLTSGLKPGSHIRRRGEDVRADDLVIAAGSLLRPQEVGMLVSLGKTSVEVVRKTRVAILATGDELLEAGATPHAGRIINSNSYSLAAQVLEAGGEPLLIGIAADTDSATREKIREGLQADMLITTGGVSVGDRDYVKESIQELGGRLLFWKVNMKPGKPVAFALLDGKPVFALPGNPVAAMVGFEMFVRPAMLRMMGHSRIFRPVVRAVLAEEAKNRGDRPHLVRVRVTLRHGVYSASTTDSQSSANLASLTQGNGLLNLAPNTSIAAGSTAEVVVLDRGFEMGSIAGDNLAAVE
ncbi:MAG: molybdopterin molybdotransferase MoeA [Deltaproteobacteria bacterium]|nr:molybdopterin molybdotransferase MoeA [Deltaproteobacteria bacterium]